MDDERPATIASGPGPVGLGPDARLLYAALLESRGELASARERLAPGLGVEQVDSALAALVALRLAHRVGGETVELVSPTEAAEEVLGPREAAAYASLREAAELRSRLRELAPIYRSAVRDRDSAGSAELLRDGEEVRDRLAEISDGVRFRIRSAHPTMAPQPVLDAALASDGKLLARGIDYEQLFTHTARRYHLSMNYLRAMQRLGAKVRTASVIPSRLILVDDDYAVLPVHSAEASAAIVRDKQVIGYLHEVFDFLWERGQRLAEQEQEGEDTVPQEVELAILHELAEGRTDEAIARRLGISSRTLRRYLTSMFESFRVETRFQLGMAAARLNLVNPPEDRS